MSADAADAGAGDWRALEGDPAALLGRVRSIAIVGASHKPARPAHQVQAFLQARGYEVFPVNPGQAGGEILGRPVFARLADLPRPVDMIDVFRNPAQVPALVDEILALPWRPKVIWMQLGITSEEAASKARTSGIAVVMNRCPKIELF
jgi:predicted CoA-binding protein